MPTRTSRAKSPGNRKLRLKKEKGKPVPTQGNALMHDLSLTRRLTSQACSSCCPKTDTNDAFNFIRLWQGKENIESSMRYAARMNIPLFPKATTPQFVLGTTKHILPYFVFPESFHVVSLSEEAWSLAMNCKLIRCIAISKPPMIRVVTQPEKLFHGNDLSVTGRELCILIHDFKYQMMKWTSTHNVYFLFRPDLSLDDMNQHLDRSTSGGNPDPWQPTDVAMQTYFDGYDKTRREKVN